MKWPQQEQGLAAHKLHTREEIPQRICDLSLGLSKVVNHLLPERSNTKLWMRSVRKPFRRHRNGVIQDQPTSSPLGKVFEPLLSPSPCGENTPIQVIPGGHLGKCKTLTWLDSGSYCCPTTTPTHWVDNDWYLHTRMLWHTQEPTDQNEQSPQETQRTVLKTETETNLLTFKKPTMPKKHWLLQPLRARSPSHFSSQSVRGNFHLSLSAPASPPLHRPPPHTHNMNINQLWFPDLSSILYVHICPLKSEWNTLHLKLCGKLHNIGTP